MVDSLRQLAALDTIQQREVAVIGFDDTAAAHALNLRDSGVDVRVGLLGSRRTARRIEAEGFYALTPEEATGDSDLIALVSDGDPAELADLLTTRLGPLLAPGTIVVLGRGEIARFHPVAVPEGVDVVMVRAMAPGQILRSEYVDGRGVPALVGVHIDASGGAWPLAASYAAALGALRARLTATTIEAEAEATTFSRSVIQPLVGEALTAGYATLVRAGYPDDLAYAAAVHEIKEMVDALYAGGLSSRSAAAAGEGTSGDILTSDLEPGLLERLREQLAGIQAARQAPVAEQPAVALEGAGTELRRAMSWLRA